MMAASRLPFLLSVMLSFLLAPGIFLDAREDSVPSARDRSLPRRSETWTKNGQAIERGLRFLKSRQQGGALGKNFSVATTGLAGLAVLGAGHHPGQEPYGSVLEGCLRYLRSVAHPVSGYITEPGKSESRMHGHCYAVLFLTQLQGSLPPEREDDLVTLVRRGIRLIERAQSRHGGWYYWDVNKQDEDEASVTVCALQALRAARNVGFAVDRLTVKGALRYVADCQIPDGSFRYRLDKSSKTTFTLSVAALSTLNAAGVYESPELRLGMDYVRRELARHPQAPWKAVEDEYPFYGGMYAAQALYQDHSRRWNAWYEAMSAHLLKRQRDDGAWESPYGDEYATAAALLILEVPRGYLPVFQR